MPESKQTTTSVSLFCDKANDNVAKPLVELTMSLPVGEIVKSQALESGKINKQIKNK